MKQYKYITLFFLLASFCAHIKAQRPERIYESATITNNQLNIKVSDGEIIITPYSPTSFEIQFKPTGQTSVFPSYAINSEIFEGQVNFTENKKQLNYSTGQAEIIITKHPFNISYYKNDRLILSEEQGFYNSDSHQGFRFKIDSDELFMGGGERALGMNRRGHKLQLYNRASYGYETRAELMYYSMPLLISSKKYMLGFDNGASGWLDIGKTDTNIIDFEAVSGRTSYLIVLADTWQELSGNFAALTGNQPMLPRWSLGNISSRMGYHSQEEVESVIDKYIEDDIPLDGIVLDLYWFGPDVKGHMGNLEWYRDSFPQPELMLERNKAKGVKTILITEPFILKESGKFTECKEQQLLGTDSIGQPYIFDFFFGTTALLDIFKQEAKDWFWSIYKKHTLSGVDGWWGDLGEPEVHPDDLMHVNGKANEVHNLYGHEWSKVLYDGFEQDFPSRRPVILMRSGFIGSQRYGLVPWSGDVSRSWGGLQSQVEIALQMGLQGLAYMHSDLGGFAGAYEDAELYTRWLQYGVFQPIYRTHAQEDVPPEPVFWDENTKRIVRNYINLRYQLTPYTYTLMHENNTLGLPLMRPLFYLEDKLELINETKTYMWGNDILVSPVVEKGITSQSVYLPKGYHWINYHTGEKHNGGNTIKVPVDIETIPVFIKAGSFITMAPVFQNMEEYTTKQLSIHYYHDESIIKSDGYIYDDDGKTKNAVTNQQYEKIVFEFENNDSLSFKIMPQKHKAFDNQLAEREIKLIIHDLEMNSKHVRINGKKYKVSAKTNISGNQNNISFYCKDQKQLTVNFKLTSQPIEIITE